MNYAQIKTYDTANGPGLRSSLFVSGCSHHCPGCFNTPYQAFSYGKPWDKKVEDAFVHSVKDQYCRGASILGGEPFDQVQNNDLAQLLARIKRDTAKAIWIWSGYTFEEIMQDETRLAILEHCDVLVDGRFIATQKDLRLRFRGSRNQRIIDINNSLKSEKIIKYEV